jgi:hypothetical protein
MRSLFALVVLTPACTANRTVAVTPEPDPLAVYFHAHDPDDLQVTDLQGRKVWISNPELVGDSIVGLASRELPHQRRAIPLAEVRGLAEPHFSTGRTLGLVAGVLGAAGTALLIVSQDGPQPVD